MTDDELRAHWGEETPVPVAPNTPGCRIPTGAIVVDLFVTMAAVLALLWPGIMREADEERARQIRICEMTKAMGGATPMEAELLCAREWER